MPDTMEILSQAVKEVSETGTLSFPARRRLWLAFGPYEEKPGPGDDPLLYFPTQPQRKRGLLAWACAKKVSRIWAAYDPDDCRPQRLLRETAVYLRGELTPGALSTLTGAIDDWMQVSDNDPGDPSPAAAIAAWDAAIVALHDEPLLDPRYEDAADSDLDPYDWDTAKNAAMAWRDKDTGGDPGKRAVREMRYWAWYLEEAAKLLEVENFRFPQKAIRAFAAKQQPERPVPEEVTLESLAAYLGAGEFQYVTRSRSGWLEEPVCYCLRTRVHGEKGVCPVCQKETDRFDLLMAFNYLETKIPGSKISLKITQVAPLFRCPHHPDQWVLPPSEEVVPKAAFKRYLAGAGRGEALLRQLEERKVNSCELLGGSVTLCGNNKLLAVIDWAGFLPEEGAGWLDKEQEEWQLDLKKFGPQVYYKRETYLGFLERYPDRARTLADGTVELTMEDYWVYCHLDEAGQPERLVLKGRFRVQLDDPERYPQLPGLLQDLLGLDPFQAVQAVQQSEKASVGWELPILSGLEKQEAIRLCHALRRGGVPCRTMPLYTGETPEERGGGKLTL